ncbi:hypothetical protein UFOVP747_53 [uncultured Caudovirales phage]|uniref:Uncharacterized protein n=1 Tax=uncultured Caudovirales phage TaxID=2100421 RepID=A0A6J5NJF0_9CAUD|nr:hypothetical protein UFOVP675_46 [uncultured Caudovirales phage]CAB5225603.1 hypothetical protein UFOVP747_53 [uncultured Caudovirales phage]
MIDMQAVIANSPEKNGQTIAETIGAAWKARAARYAEGRLAEKKARVATELADGVRDA